MAIVNLLFDVDVIGTTSGIFKQIFDINKMYDFGTDAVMVDSRTLTIATGANDSLASGSSEAAYLDGLEFDYGVVLSNVGVTLAFYGGSSEADNSAVTLLAGVPFIFSNGTTTTYDGSPTTRPTTADLAVNLDMVVRNDSGSTAYVEFMFLRTT